MVPSFAPLGLIPLFRVLLGLGTALAIFQWQRSRYWRAAGWLGALLIAGSNVRNLNVLHGSFVDMRLFWLAGDALRHGQDPYVASAILHTPNALPLFELFSLVPLPLMANLWKAFNLLGCLCLVPLAAIFIKREGGGQARGLPFGQQAALSLLVAFSYASMDNINGGQLHILVALALLGTLLLRQAQHPILAGLTASLGFLKVQTGLPMMPVFMSRKSDIKLVIALALAILAQVLIASWPDRLPSLLRSELRAISTLAAPGGGNDYAYSGPASAGIISIDHTLYRVGLQDRSLLSKLQLGGSLILGALLSWKAWRGAFSPLRTACLFSLFSVTFLYHRIYDTLLLALPLTFSLVQFQSDLSRSSRLKSLLAAMAVVGLFYVPENLLYELTKHATGLSWAVRALILPLPYWLICAALVLMWSENEEVGSGTRTTSS